MIESPNLTRDVPRTPSCAAITAALIGISFSTATTNNDLSLSTGENAIQELALQIQDRVSTTIIQDINVLAMLPVLVLSNLVKLIDLGYLNPLSTDMMIPYLYKTIAGFDQTPIQASYLYFASQSTGNFVNIGKENFAPPWLYQVVLQDNLQSQPNGSACPKLCPQNMPPNTLTFWNLKPDGSFNKTDSILNVPYNTRGRPWYVQAVNASKSVPVWSPVYVYSDPEHSVGITTSQAVYSSSGTLLGVAAVDLTFGALSTNLRALPLTANGFAFIFNTNQILFGSSVLNESPSIMVNVSGAISNDLKNITMMTDLNSRLVVQTILASCKNDLTRLPSSGTYQAGGLIFQHNSYSDPYGLDIIVATGAPLSDYIGAVEGARETMKNNLNKSNAIMIGVAVGLCLVFVALSVPATFTLIGRPLAKLAVHMEEASKFDFSALHGKDKNARSSIKELSMIESAYWNMITKFAEAIQQNKSLASRNHAASSVNAASVHDPNMGQKTAH
ncbi:hypothetical protein HK101_007231 [Irineochytrium annulatum]|nr:hypothetical protein HK101_007231 [Irineochytrium annulatum]